jgi:hypothetical protein
MDEQIRGGKVKHKVFISYYDKDDAFYRKRFEDLFGDLFINKSVSPGDIDTDISTEYVKRLIQQEYITDCSVLVVLVGAKTHGRKYIDWEISAALNKKVGEKYSGLLGICLPTHPDYNNEKFRRDIVPTRLVDNINSGYASFYNWTENKEIIQSRINTAFDNRISKSDKIDNSREQVKINTCE